MSRKLFPVSVVASAVALSLAGADALALGLGRLRVQSALNQPFAAEIDLLDVKPDELDTVNVELAPSDEFSKVGAQRFHYLTKLKFSTQISPRGDTVIRVTSREPIREPYMDFLIETIWPQGRLVREYTVLLDPPVTASGRPRQVVPPVTTRPRPQRGRVAPPPLAPSSEPERSASPPPAPVAYEPGYPLRVGPVRPGNGLWRLAVRNSPAGATVAQTAMALYRNNQGAFIRGDINRLLVDKTLTIPSSAELFALGPNAAQREFQAALRGEKVRRAPIAPVPTGTPADDAHLKIAGSSAPRPTPTTQQPGVAPTGQTRVDREMEQELLLAREASETARQETSELRTRILELENQLTEIQKLLQLRNAELARIQGSGSPEDAGSLAGEPSAEEPSLDEPAPLPPEIEEAIAAIELPVPGEPGSPEAETDSGLASSEAATQPLEPIAEIEDARPGAAVVPDAAVVEEPTPDQPEVEAIESVGAEIAPPPARTEPSEPGRLAETETPAGAGFPWQLALIGAGALAGVGGLAGGVFAWTRSRRRRGDEDAALDSAFGEDSQFGSLTEDASEPVSKEYQHLEQGGDSRSSALSPTSTLVDLSRSSMETDEADVISEADIYIAYGRYMEAEDLLVDEIRRSPDRLDLKFKLAEAYIGSRKHGELRVLLEEMRAAGADKAHPEQWQRLARTAARTSRSASRDIQSGQERSVWSGPGETVDLDASPEALPLDIGDVGDPSLELSSEKVPGPDLDLGDHLPSESTQYSGSMSPPPAPSSSDAASGHAEIGSEEFSSPLDLEIDSEQLGEDLDRVPPREPASTGRARGGGANVRDFTMTETDLDIGALPGASELDIDSLLDPGESENQELESLLGSSTVPPPRVGEMPLRPVTTGPETQQTPATDLPVTGIAAESPSSDLLSSQWQVDSGLWDETATKLDLARAYVDMADSDSARGILEEVITEGNDEQRAEAKSLLGKIA